MINIMIYLLNMVILQFATFNNQMVYDLLLLMISILSFYVYSSYYYHRILLLTSFDMFCQEEKPLTSDQGQVCGRTFNMDRIAKHQAGPFFDSEGRKGRWFFHKKDRI